MSVETSGPVHGLEADRYSPKVNCGFQMPSSWAKRLDEAVRLRTTQVKHRISKADFFREAVKLHMDRTLEEASPGA